MQKTQVSKKYNKCSICGNLKLIYSKLCQKCWNDSGNANRGTSKGWKIDNHGYKKIRILNHPHIQCDGYIPESRYIMEQYLKCYLESHLDVHHINGNRLDNRLENLELLTHGEHRAKHHKKKKQDIK